MFSFFKTQNTIYFLRVFFFLPLNWCFISFDLVLDVFDLGFDTLDFLRIDFGCCLSVKNCPESYFVNEIEMLTANLLSEYTNYAVIPKLGNIFYKLSEKVKYAKNQKGVYTPLHFKNVSMCKN